MSALGVLSVATELEDALSLGGRALAWAEAHGTPALVSASFRAQALVLGKLQREDTLRERSDADFANIVRRSSTGTEAQLSGSTLYHALALPRVDALYPDASARTLLNRNLRALLRGYTAAGVPLRYFGTEVLSLLGHPVALVGYDQAASGATLIEVLVGLENPCVVRPALKREAPASLGQILRRALDARELLDRVVTGTLARLGAEAVDVALPAAEPAPLLQVRGPSSSVAIPLGVVEVARARGLRITGDLLVSSFALARVEQLAQAALERGAELDEAVLQPLTGAALDGARPGDVLQALRGARE